MSIDIVNATQNEQYVLVNVVRGANTSAGEYNIYWPSAVPSDTAAYQLIFLDYASGGFAGSSNTFNLTLPAGEQRNSSVGNAPQGPSQSATSTPVSARHGLSTSATVAAAVVPTLVVVIAVATGAFFFLRRRRRPSPSNEQFSEFGKAELAGESKSERYNDDKPLAEMAGKDYIRWELPSTPPRDPVELPAEVPTVELDAASVHGSTSRKYPSGVAETGSTRLTSDSSNTDSPTISPFLAQSGRYSLQSPVSPRARDDATTSGRSRFEEALYDLVSDKLRRHS